MRILRHILGALLAVAGALALSAGYKAADHDSMTAGGILIAMGFMMAPGRRKDVSFVSTPVILVDWVPVRPKRSSALGWVLFALVMFLIYKIFGGGL